MWPPLGRIIGVVDPQDAEVMARRVAQCLDTNGAWGFRFPFETPGTTMDSVVATWMARGGHRFAPDTVSLGDNDEGMLIRVTVLSRLARTYSWQPISYAFAFDAHGSLLAWWRNDVARPVYVDDGSLE